jgi:amino acid adenylation domain-containing protein
MSDSEKNEALDAVAIVGMAGRFPGAGGVRELWRNLTAGVESLTFFSVEELVRAGVDPRVAASPEYVRARGVLAGVDLLDAPFFGLTPREAELMDPQHRLFMECAWEALEDAGCDPERAAGPIGVFAGLSMNTYLLNNLCRDRGFVERLVVQHQLGAFPVFFGNDKDFLTTRVSYKFNLRGPSVNIQSACSTSLVAVHQACRSLLGMECHAALAGGVSISFPQERGYAYEEGSMGSADGHCRAFDAGARGVAFGGGVAVVALKRLEDALTEGDQIYAVIRGSAINNDGSAKVSYTAPSVDAQAEVIALAQALAGTPPETIGYVEAHGTGTPLGDPIEVAALTKAFREGTSRTGFCALGSVKSNLGHLEHAAGATGLIKAALALRHRRIPASLHFERPNPDIDFASSPFYVNARLADWPAGATPRRAGVSAFGVGGTNAHVVLEEGPSVEPAPSAREHQLLLLSARTPTALDAATARLAAFLREEPGTDVADAAFTLHAGRKAFEHRRVLVAAGTEDAAEALGIPGNARFADGRAGAHPPAVAFAFPGQGAQYAGMGAEVYRTEPAYRGAVDACAEILAPILGLDIRRLLHAPRAEREEAGRRLAETSLTQPALFVVEYALARLWISWGVRPEAMVGHSIGEYVAACLAEVFPLEAALRLVASRGRLMQELPRGAMLAVRQPEGEVLASLPPGLALAAVNAPSFCVVSGPGEAIDAFEQDLAGRGVTVRRLATSHAFHSPMMEPIVGRFEAEVAAAPRRAPRIPFVSTLTGAWITDAEAVDPRYWGRQLRETVRFARAAQVLFETPGRVLLEAGPGTTLVTLARPLAAAAAGAALVSSLGDPRLERPEGEALLGALGRLWLAGLTPDWTSFHHGERRRKISLPAYPFERKRHWVEPPRPALEPGSPAPAFPCGPPTASAPPGPPHPTAAETEEEHPMPEPEPAAPRGDSMLRAVQELFSELSGMPPAEIAATTTFLDLGFDSLFLTQATQALHKEFSVKVTFRQLLNELGTPRSLAEHLAQTAPPEALPAPAPAAASAPARGVAAAAPAAGSPQLELLLAQQLEAMTRLMAQQLEAIRGGATPAPAPPPAPPVAAAAVPAGIPFAAPPEPPAAAGDAGKPEFKAFGPYKPIDKGQAGGLAAEQERRLAEFIDRYTKRTAGSKRVVQADRGVLADPRVAAGFRAQWKELVYPIVTNRAKGSRLWDVDGNEYIDILNGFGCIMFGHSPDFVTAAVARQLGEGMEIGPLSPLAGRVARKICEFTGNDRAAFCNTGSEAVMAAMRVARTVTGRSRIALFAGDYHGMFDEVLVRGLKGRSGPRSVPIAPGIPQESVSNMLVLDYGTPESLEILRANMGDLAAVLVEPVQSRRPDLQPRDFLHEVRRLTEAAGTALIFDEVVTGFRVHPAGMQAVFGVRADMATYGKVIAGGMPIGVLAGTAAFMDALDGGQWRYGDDSFPEVGVTFFAGTFVRHPLTLAAVDAVLDHLRERGPGLQVDLNLKAEWFAGELNRLFEARGLPTRVRRCGSIMHFQLPPEQRFGGLLYYHLRLRGVHVQEGFPCFVTTAHSEEDLAAVVRAFRESLEELEEGGFLPAAPAPRAVAAAAPRRHATTEAQKEIFLACQMGPEAACAYNASLTIRLRGPLHLGALRASVDRLPAQHEALRSRFAADGETFTVDGPEALGLRLIDLSDAAEEERDSAYAAIVDEESLRPFDLGVGPLARALLVRFGEGDHRLLLMAHHIVCDGWSFVVLLQDLSLLYTAKCHGTLGDLPEALPFSEYAAFDAGRRGTEEYGRARDYWLRQYAEPVAALQLPTDRPRPPVRTYPAGLERVVIDAELFKAVKRVGAKAGCTQFATMLSAFMVLLHRLSGQEDVVVAVPAAGQSVIGRDELVGHCANLLPVRGRPAASASFASFLAQMRQAVMDAYDNQSYTYGTLVHELALPRDPSRHPLLAVMFNIDRGGFRGLEMAGLATELVTNPKASVIFDLNVNIIETDLGLELNCDYKTDLFDAVTIRGWLESFQVLLAALAADPDRPLAALPMLTPLQERALLEDGNRTAADYPQAPAHALIAAQAARTPGATAVSCGESSWTYRELDERAGLVAAHLRGLGIGPGALVAVYLERSLEMVAALLGVLKAGGAYVPLDPSYPAERIALVLDDAAAGVVLTQESLLPTLAGREGAAICLDRDWNRIAQAAPAGAGAAPALDDLAYVIYTSGSTGRPKGVQVTHRGLVNFLTSMAREPGFTAADTLLAVTTLSFDIAGLELYLPLLVGGRVAIASREETWDGVQLARRLETCGATVMQATPATWQLLLQADWRPSRPVRMLCGGEALPRELANRLLDRSPELWNMYGPTETTIWSTVARVERGEGPIFLGRPIDNTQLYVVDAALRPTAPGVPGELLIGGDGVARGYQGRPDLTAERFVPDPFRSVPGARVYRTGDLVRRRADGELAFLGRIDNQVKIRGFRIELGEIEATLEAHAAVRENVVLAREDVPGEKRLVAYLVPADGGEAAAIVPLLRAHLTEKLPPYMVPAAFVVLPALPRTPNGKVDRRALAPPDSAAFVSAQEYVAPRSAAETTLADIWAAVLHLERVGVKDSVFDLGADSLLIFQMAARARQAGLAISPAQIFELRTIEELAAKATAGGGNVATPTIAAVSRDAYRRKR